MTLSIALVQASFQVGNIVLNMAKIASLYRLAAVAKAQLVVFSEMAITGYPPEDLVLSAPFQVRTMRAVEECAAMTETGPAMIIGGLWCENGEIHNTVFLLDQGKIVARQYKYHLPNYGVFDDKRIFNAGPLPEPIRWRDTTLGLLICEDLWFSDVSQHLKDGGAELLIAINASPFEIGKPKMREELAAQRSRETSLPIVYVNQICGHDDLIFDGHSFVLNAKGETCWRMQGFREDFFVLNLTNRIDGHAKSWEPMIKLTPYPMSESEVIYRAIVLGLQDFVRKAGFSGVVLGMSGGIDSALSAALAVDAVGQKNVRTVMLPSPYTSVESLEDAAECALRLGVRFDTVSIESGMQAFAQMLNGVFDGNLTNVAKGDIQPRLRANILMAISRKENLLLLNTGNKSEMATGYTTMYGDMCGHYAAIKDIYKTTVYEIAAWRNTRSEVIPKRILTKAPTAELFHGQTDQDTLPPYALLDQILFQLIENRLGIQEVADLGFDLNIVEEVSNMFIRSEYLRRQSPPGAKISSMSLWRDRRYPICNGWYFAQHERLAKRLAENRAMNNATAMSN